MFSRCVRTVPSDKPSWRAIWILVRPPAINCNRSHWRGAVSYTHLDVYKRQEPDEALKTADEAIGFARRTGQHLWEGANLHNKAWAYFWLGRPEEAFSLAEASERAVRDADWLWAVLSTKTCLLYTSRCV